MKNLFVSIVISLGVLLATALMIDVCTMLFDIDVIDVFNMNDDYRVAVGILAFIYYILVLAWVYIEIEY